MSCDILHPCLCLYVHTSTCAPLFLGWVPCGEVKQGARGLLDEGHSSNSKYVSNVHPSVSGWQLSQNTHHQVGHSTRRHVPESLYSQIHPQASAFERGPTMLMRGSARGWDWGMMAGDRPYSKQTGPKGGGGLDMSKRYSIFLWPPSIHLTARGCDCV